MIACAGDVPTLEALGAADWLWDRLPDLKVRFVNVVDLMTLFPQEVHPHGMSETRFVELFDSRQTGRFRLPRLPTGNS